jgi:hypothetical protein
VINDSTRPCRRQWLEAALWALLCALAFLRDGVLPTRALLPFVPEVYEPLASEVRSDGSIDLRELDRGNRSMGDKFGQSLTWDRVLKDRLTSFDLPLWTRDIGGGASFVPQMAQVFQPWNLLLFLPVPAVALYGISYALHLFVFGLGAWWFLRRIGLSQPAAILGLVAVELGLWTQAKVHHNVILSAAVPLFWLLGWIEGAFRRRPEARALPSLRWIAITAVLFGASWSGGFPPVSLQLTGTVIVFALTTSVARRDFAPWPRLLLALGLGGVLAAPQMGPTLLAAATTARPAMDLGSLAREGLEFVQLESLWMPDRFVWADPRTVGGQSGPPWAALEALPHHKAASFNYPETAFAVGTASLLVAVHALRRLDRTTLVFLLFGIVGVGLATASEPFLTLSGLLPGARAGDQKRFLFLASMALAVLAAQGADEVLRSRRPWTTLLLAATLAIAGGVSLLVDLSMTGDLEAFRQHWAERLAAAQKELGITAAVARAAMDVRPFEAENNLAAAIGTHGRLFLIASACVALFAFARGGARVRGLAALAAIELLHVGHGTLVAVPLDRVSRTPAILGPVVAANRNAADAGLPRPRMQRLDLASSTALFPPNLPGYHRIEDLGAYNPLPPARLEEFFDAIEPRSPASDGRRRPGASVGGAGVGALRRVESLDHPLLDLFDCRFVLARIRDLTVDGALRLPTGVRALPTPPSAGAEFVLLERTTVMPRATFVEIPSVIADRARRLEALGARDRDPRREIILEDPAVPIPNERAPTPIEPKILLHADEVVVVRVATPVAGYLRLADPYDPGWSATIDGRPTRVYPADHYARAVFVPAGDHLVEFRFGRFDRTAIWNYLGLIASLTVILLLSWPRPRR